MSTKERILDEALTLFSENGYDGTGVEQIAEKVGIKAPSLYKHYRGKEDILNTLIDKAEARYEASFGSEQHIGKLPESREEFIRVTMERILFTMRDPMIRKIRKFLVQEQFRNDRLAAITTRHQFEGVQRMYTKIVGAMMEQGLFVKDDPALLADELTAPVVLLVAKADRQPQLEQEITGSIDRHIRHFCDVYMSVQAK
ncbi:TetR/AcrR family transcriptional regulator [Ruminococcus sp.]|uniref:TetR/AcrR family transcriptional regulator n=1 Tax=Ruminococcus sp. TaxID=41978 RepID=UPI0038908DC5